MTRVLDRSSGKMVTRPYPKQPVTIADSTREAMAAWREDVAAWCREQDYIALTAGDQDLALQLVQQWREAVPGVRAFDGASRIGDEATPIDVVATPLSGGDEKQAHRLHLSLELIQPARERRRGFGLHRLLLVLAVGAAIGARVAGGRS